MFQVGWQKHDSICFWSLSLLWIKCLVMFHLRQCVKPPVGCIGTGERWTESWTSSCRVPASVLSLPELGGKRNICIQSRFEERVGRDTTQLLTMEHDQRQATLTQLAEKSVAVISPAKSQNWFQRSQGYIPSGIQKLDILSWTRLQYTLCGIFLLVFY